MWYSTTQLAKKEKVTSQTIRQWVKVGRYGQIEWTKGGHLRIWVDSEPEVILYCRVSSSKQSSSLQTQQQRLTERYPKGRVVSDVGSGFNFKRRGFEAVLEQVLRGKPVALVASTSDRITRVGFQLIRKIIELSGGRIELLEEEVGTDQFDTKTLVSFITSFCNSHYGKRSNQRHPKNPTLPQGSESGSGTAPTTEESL